jgi:hypothetical protein
MTYCLLSACKLLLVISHNTLLYRGLEQTDQVAMHAFLAIRIVVLNVKRAVGVHARDAARVPLAATEVVGLHFITHMAA